MRIAYDARPLIQQKTGIGRYVRCFLEALLAYPEVREILLCSPRGIETGNALARDQRVKEWVQRGWKGNVWLQVAVPFLLGRCKPNLFHATLFLSPLLSRCPSVVNIYDLTVYRHPGTMESRNKWPLKFLLPRAVSRADRIITLSAFTKQEIAERWPDASHKIAVVPGAPYLSPDRDPDVSGGSDPERILAQYGVQRPYLLYVGTMDPRKNIVRMLKTFEQILAMGARDIQFVLVGHEGWGVSEVRRAWESSPGRSAIRYLGYVPDDALAVLYRCADLFFYLSLYEGFGFPPLEAMAAGTCVVASNQASLPECLGDAAVLADPFDTDAAAGIVFRLLQDEELRRDYVRRGFQQAASYSWRRSAEKILDVYRELA
jgi:glycosyltransferase involved in cell wall biosynthesis